MHAVSTNQIADILHYNDKAISETTPIKIKKQKAQKMSHKTKT